MRPALTRALAAHAADPKVREAMTGLVMSGQDLFRAVVIEALGDYKAAYALQPIMDVARLEGPLQDDAFLAIGRIGDKRGLTVLADAPTHRAAEPPALDCRGNLSARQQLRIARQPT